MQFNSLEWANLLVRWTHVFSAILWVGSTYYFTWLDGQMRKGGDRPVWMVHSGGFYTVVKQKTLGVPPGEVHWFRYEALATFLSGFVLLNLVYYHGGLMVDPIDPKVSPLAAGGIGVATLRAGWTMCALRGAPPALAENEPVFAVVGFLLIAGTAYTLSLVLAT